MAHEIVPIFDTETAKAVQKASDLGGKVVDAGVNFGRYTASVFGSLPHNLVGIAGDFIEHKRRMRAAELDREYQQLLRDRGVKEPIEPSPSILIPLLNAAIDEDREMLKSLWARLLANACDPARKDRVRQSFIELLKKFDPFDAVVLELLGAVSGAPQPNARDYVRTKTNQSENEVMVSLDNLVELGCLARTGEHWNPHITPRGRLLLDAVSK